MLRSSLLSASAILLCCATTASAQQQVQARKVLGAVKDAGIYHVATGTWTRNNSSANLGPDIIYRNDHGSGYFGVGWEGSKGVDEGILPGPGNPFVGTQDCYEINGLSFSYCALGAGPGITWDLELYDSYVACDDPDIPANCINSAWTMATGNLPGNSGCWIVTFDLVGGAEAQLAADGGTCAPGYQGGALGLDGYGFGQTWLNGGNTAGPILSGNPNWAPRGDGTCYQPNMTCAAGATGLGEQDLFGIGTPLNGCFWFGGYVNTNGCGLSSQGPTGSMNHTLFADCTVTCDPGGGGCETVSCDEGTDANNVADASVGNDCNGTDGNLILTAANGPADQFCYALISVTSGAVVDPPGADGTLCVTGQIGRYAKDTQKFDSNGDASIDLMNATSGGGGGNVPVIGGNIIGGTWNCQWWHRTPGGGPSGFSSLVTFGPVQ
jgi:hypothetical protein